MTRLLAINRSERVRAVTAHRLPNNANNRVTLRYARLTSNFLRQRALTSRSTHPTITKIRATTDRRRITRSTRPHGNDLPNARNLTRTNGLH